MGGYLVLGQSWPLRGRFMDLNSTVLSDGRTVLKNLPCIITG